MKFLNVIFMFLCLSGFAQSKVGTINVDFVLSKMPEFTAAQAEIEKYGTQLDTDLEAKLAEYEVLIKDYQDNEATFTLKQKQEKQQAIITTENDINNFRQNGAKLITIKRDEVLRPLYKKIGVAIEAIAKELDYTQVLQIDDSLVYIDEDYDITVLVLKQLGVSLDPEKE
ncbi:MAG: OmpH family outer membrane protein [Flavobacteriales bacterium]|jgi:outer membrane protein|uniref:OmpH family outer membrane protein n=1 Tax=Candidatus Ulvibacter alkanivorans TaxID=2267620 RepID=UPI000DF42759|nr:OmpH family outer membrane protein [Candidatus Ulvibacter alkanivorans]MCH2489730.1 OmpH family outer membrane protein [Flavobacteriales bacterium]